MSDRRAVDKEALLDVVEGDEEFLKVLVGTFLEDCPEYLESLRRAVEEEDGEALVQEAHGLKGAVANLKAEPARRAAARLEELGRAGALDEAADALEELEEEMDRLTTVLNEMIQES